MTDFPSALPSAATLAPCPFCAGQLTADSAGRSYLHPANNCVISVLELLPAEIAAWNRRAQQAQLTRMEGVLPVYQVRIKGNAAWSDCTREIFHECRERGTYETQTLYMVPGVPPVAPWNGGGLPPVGVDVRFDTASAGEAVGTVTGYNVWPALENNPAVHRVFVNVTHKDTDITNTRLLMDVRPLPSRALEAMPERNHG
ncbi:hypothetical protein R70006_06225 [Paraburkholderia domus]|uniref:hypothetical protein n=1 Tax=Paraburkholderia domus TaxID=2793075 RepID=UPI001913D6B8|nr:hypothetical protein [Paraburkholderia domus]MBK5052856.1 hypothetical protein [Burkholderia sp. R-70006]CAE6821570.1 hypothetical protein R70006_06225 [Paraburkholderia domus]